MEKNCIVVRLDLESQGNLSNFHFLFSFIFNIAWRRFSIARETKTMLEITTPLLAGILFIK
jgi:hypothetical protein